MMACRCRFLSSVLLAASISLAMAGQLDILHATYTSYILRANRLGKTVAGHLSSLMCCLATNSLTPVVGSAMELCLSQPDNQSGRWLARASRRFVLLLV